MSQCAQLPARQDGSNPTREGMGENKPATDPFPQITLAGLQSTYPTPGQTDAAEVRVPQFYPLSGFIFTLRGVICGA